MNKNANFWANVGANLSNLKALFAPPKWLKVFLGFVSVIYVIGIIVAFALNIATKDKVYNANLTLHEQKIALDDKRNKINGEFSYTARIAFSSLAPLLRSSSISNVRVIKYAWDNAVDFNAFKGLTHSKRNVFFNSTQDLGALGLESLGIVEYRVDFSPLMKNILWRFVDIVIFVIVFFALWRVFVDLLHSLPTKNTASESTRALLINRKDYIFLAFAFLLCAGICAFTFWLGFPGYHIIGDTYNSIALVKDNAHPVFIAYILQGLYLIFGKNLYYLFLFNLIPFYLGLFFLIAGFYLRYKNPFALMLIFPTFIGNIYFQNFIQYHSFALPMMLFCIYSLLLFFILAESRAKILWIFLFMLMFFAILWRHNAIFSVFPAFFVIIYLFLEKRDFKPQTFVKTYFKFVVLSAVLCLAVVIIVPKILQVGKSYPANHPFLHQIAGACVPANDSSCFKDEWYYPHKSFSDVKALYEKYPLNADPFNVAWAYGGERPFKHEKLQGLKTQWIKSIAKHPLNFLTHEARFFKAMWFQNPAWMFDTKKMQEKAKHEWHISVVSDFKESQRSIAFTPLQEKIYSFLFYHKIVLNHAWGVSVGFIILVLSSVILWKRRKGIFTNVSQNNALLVFCFSVSFASFWSAFFIAAFSTVPESRYMSPILPISIIALTGFIALCLEIRAKRA